MEAMKKQRGGAHHFVHGLHGTRIYTIWKSMKERCYTKTSTKYPIYGARGIRVCPEWEHDAKAFYEWAINNGYKDGLTIDRIDVNGDYSPDNCRWADLVTQANNKRNNVLVFYGGKAYTIAEFCREYGLNYKNFYQNYKRRHNPLEVSMQRAKIKEAQA